MLTWFSCVKHGFNQKAMCLTVQPSHRPVFCLKSFPRQSGTAGGLAVLHRNSLTKKLQYLLEILFLPPPPSQENKVTNVLFFGAVVDLLIPNYFCWGLIVLGDLNVHFDKPSDPNCSALNVVLDNLSLCQLVKVPTHSHGHTLDWLITNRATDVLDLTAVDMLLSDHFAISFDPSLRKIS